jgi:ParB family chromosome partitioning protein
MSAPPPPSAPAVPPAGAEVAGPPTTVQQQEFNRDRHPGIGFASLDEIQVNAYQPRREFDDQALAELSQSIRSNGIIQPLIVRRGAAGGYHLIAGERRLRAAKLAGLKQVPIVIRRSTDREALELALIENIQRQDLNCIDEALAYFQLMQDFSLTQEEVAERVGKERVTVANHLRLLRLPEAIIDDLKRGILTFGHGRALLSLEDPDLRLKARALVIEGGLSVRRTEELVEKLKSEAVAEAPAPVPPATATPVEQRLHSVSQELTRRWSTRVEIKGSERRGKIVLYYASRQDLDRLLEAMQNQTR